MLLRNLIVLAVTSGLAKKAWDRHLRNQKRKPLVDITELIARPVASADPTERRRATRSGARRRREGPGS